MLAPAGEQILQQRAALLAYRHENGRRYHAFRDGGRGRPLLIQDLYEAGHHALMLHPNTSLPGIDCASWED